MVGTVIKRCVQCPFFRWSVAGSTVSGRGRWSRSVVEVDEWSVVEVDEWSVVDVGGSRVLVGCHRVGGK